MPRSLAVVQALRTIVISPLSDIGLKLQARKMVPQLEAEVVALGRSFSTTTVAAGGDERVTVAQAEARREAAADAVSAEASSEVV